MRHTTTRPPSSAGHYRDALTVAATTFVVVVACSLWGLADPTTVPMVIWLEPDSRHPFFADFTLHYWPAAVRCWQQLPPAPGFQYPPGAAVALAPLAAIGNEGLAKGCWAIVLALSAAAIAAAPLPNETRRARVILGLLVVTSVPVWHAVRWGQVSLPLTALAIWGSVSASRLWAGWPLGLAVGMKIYPAVLLPVVAFGSLTRRPFWQALGAAVLCGVALPVLALGPRLAMEWFAAAALTLSDSSTSWMQLNSNSQFVPNVVQRFIEPAGTFVALASTAVAVCILAWAVFEARTGHHFRGLALSWLSLPFWAPPVWPHYFVFLPWVLMVLDGDVQRRPLARVLWTWAAVLSSLAGLAVAGGWMTYVSVGVLAIADSVLVTIAVSCRHWDSAANHRAVPGPASS